MTVADDLATLRVLTTGHWTTRAALDRVEAEIARLETERATLQITRDQLAQLREAAEAEAARLRGIIRAHWSPSQAEALLAEEKQ